MAYVEPTAPAVARYERSPSALLERDVEVEELLAQLRSARAGEGRVAVIEGHPGIGKSRLLEELALRAEGLEILTARATTLETDLPFGVALQLFERALRSLERAHREHAWRDAAGLAAPLFDGSGAGLGRGSVGGLLPLIHGLYWLTANLAEQRPLLLSVDDAHWADPPSLRFLSYLAERLEGMPICLVAASRGHSEGAEHALLDSPRTTRLSPAPLTEAAVADLIRAELPDAEDAFCSACAGATGGNPLLVVELLAEVKSQELAPRAEAVETVHTLASRRLSRRVAARLARLSPEAGALAGPAAIFSAHPEQRHVAALAELDARQAAAAADELAAAGLFAPGGSPVYCHPLLCAAVLDGLPPGRRDALHLGAARVLHDAGLPPERVATHLEAARPSGERWAYETLRAAARRALEEGAPTSAVHWLRRAVAGAPMRADRCAALADLGRAELAAGQSTATQRLAEAVELEADPRRRAAVALELGRALSESGELSRAAEVLERARSELDGRDDALATELEAAWVLIARHIPSLKARSLEQMGSLIDRPRAPSSNAERVLLAAAANQAAFAGEPRARVIDLAHRALDRGALLSHETSDGTTWAIALAALGWADELQTVAWTAEMGLEDARARGSIVGFATASFARAYPYLQLGRVAEAAADCRQAIDSHGNPSWILFPFACVQLAHAELELGDPDSAEEAIERWEPERHWADAPAYIPILEARGRIALARRRPKDALELLLECGRRAEEALVLNPVVVPWRSTAVVAALRLEDRERARELAAEQLGRARRFGAPRTIAVALRSAGLAEGGERGLALLQAAVSALEGTRASLELARTLVALGTAQRRNGRRAKARVHLRRGLELAERCGALALAARARDELKAAGARRVDPAGSRGPDGLTPSELRVARLAASGMTNREIAQALFVTRKAVQFHLTNVYRKLEIPGREQLRDRLA